MGCIKPRHMCYTALSLQGVDLDKLMSAGQYISEYLGRKPASKVLQAKIASKL